MAGAWLFCLGAFLLPSGPTTCGRHDSNLLKEFPADTGKTSSFLLQLHGCFASCHFHHEETLQLFHFFRFLLVTLSIFAEFPLRRSVATLYGVSTRHDLRPPLSKTRCAATSHRRHPPSLFVACIGLGGVNAAAAPAFLLFEKSVHTRDPGISRLKFACFQTITSINATDRLQP